MLTVILSEDATLPVTYFFMNAFIESIDQSDFPREHFLSATLHLLFIFSYTSTTLLSLLIVKKRIMPVIFQTPNTCVQ